jgi:cellulose synthase/poly-beta-1,6-N-acetylglucosamine synthase-like glycosyltransferase
MRAIFWFSVCGMFFAYFGYPLCLWAIGLLRSRRVDRRPLEIPVSMIITAYNEEKRIALKLENTFGLDYPPDKLEIIVASDGSTDRTHAIVDGFKARGVRMLALERRQGKEHAQKQAVQIAHGELFVFSDVATRLEPQGLRQIVANFADPTVGCVSSEDRLLGQDGKPAGEGMYVRYEMWLRRLESRVNSLVGLSGSFFAARREVCKDFSSEMQSDFRTLLNSIKLGMRGICDPRVVGYYQDISNPKNELDRKIRTVLRGLTVFFRHIELLNVFRYGLFSWQLLCHKLIRWLVPLFMAAALFSNFLLAWSSVFYLVLFGFQVIFYAVAAAVTLGSGTTKSMALKLPSYFLTVNMAILLAWYRYLKGERVVMWEPSKR